MGVFEVRVDLAGAPAGGLGFRQAALPFQRNAETVVRLGKVGRVLDRFVQDFQRLVLVSQPRPKYAE